jgi:Protein of unknown function (DUF2946)
MTHRWSIGRAGVALVAAYALALQVLLASFGVGGAVIGHQLAGIAGAICTSKTDGSAPGAPVDHDRADCCILCSAPGPGSIDPTDVLAVVRHGSSYRLTAQETALHLGIAWLPGGARAPPSRA